MKKIVVMLAVLVLCASSVMASQAIVSVGSRTDSLILQDNRSSGYEFTVGAQDIRVTSVGFLNIARFKNEVLPLSQADHDVAIFDAQGAGAGTKLVQGTVLAGSDMTADFFSWATVTPTLLSAGHTYRVMAEAAYAAAEASTVYDASLPVFANPADLTIGDGWGTNETEVHTNGTTGALFGNQNWQHAWGEHPYKGYSTNFQYEIPEPATMGLLGLGLAGMIIRRKK